ncbi:hypothetical protein ILYODFUR_022038 [Ilyodon furcidens]|uniref:Uncharacterized protein n=1 Tax=Ilyodon furcidens TaxID=33524 RepID=A0ABV0SNY9_9TELE
MEEQTEAAWMFSLDPDCVDRSHLELPTLGGNQLLFCHGYASLHCPSGKSWSWEKCVSKHHFKTRGV